MCRCSGAASARADIGCFHWDPQFAELAAALAAGFGARGRRAVRLKALAALALEFWTWRRLDREGLDDAAAADLMTDAVAAVVSSQA